MSYNAPQIFVTVGGKVITCNDLDLDSNRGLMGGGSANDYTRGAEHIVVLDHTLVLVPGLRASDTTNELLLICGNILVFEGIFALSV